MTTHYLNDDGFLSVRHQRQKLYRHWFKQRPIICSATVRCLNQWWFFRQLDSSLKASVDYTIIGSDIGPSPSSKYSVQENVYEGVKCSNGTQFVRPQFVIQIKICAEYRDMLPRPRLVCQEPGLRPIGRSPGVPDKSSQGLGSMSRYSAQILICFIAYIFLIFFIPLWVWLGTLQDCQCAQCPLPLSIVIRMRLVIRQSKLPACLAGVQLVHQNTLAFKS